MMPEELKCTCGSESAEPSATEKRMAEKSGLSVEFIHRTMDLFEDSFDEESGDLR